LHEIKTFFPGIRKNNTRKNLRLQVFAGIIISLLASRANMNADGFSAKNILPF